MPIPQEPRLDLERSLRAVVGLQSSIPEDAFTAPILGTERAGSGVVIREDGLVLTIGYLITEAETVWLTSMEGRGVPGHALAYDQETGFGLVQALGRLDLPALALGDASACAVGEVRTGFIWINSFGIRDLAAPFGGIKRSGVGREGGDWSFEFFCDVKDVVLPRKPFKPSFSHR